MSKSVDPVDMENNKFVHELTLDGCQLRGARGAWEAIEYCVENGLQFPDWLVRYLTMTAKRIGKISRWQHSLAVWEALGLADEQKPETYDPRSDPEEVYKAIRDWRELGVVKSITAGIRKYCDTHYRTPEDIAKRVISSGVPPLETIRSQYYRGKEIWERINPEEEEWLNHQLTKRPYRR